jgi:hypothetical protein
MGPSGRVSRGDGNLELGSAAIRKSGLVGPLYIFSYFLSFPRCSAPASIYSYEEIDSICYVDNNSP